MSPTAKAKQPNKSAAKGTGARDGRKLAEIVAERIEDEIIERGWPVGTVIGSESDLLERYGVSRAVFREAIRIVDHHGVASMRRGPGGGLVVSKPDIEAVVRAMTLLLEFENVHPDHMNEARMALELSNVRLAAATLSPEGEQRLRQHLEDEEARIRAAHAGPTTDQPPAVDFHMLLADLTGNPAMRLFIEIVVTAQTRQSPRATRIDEFAHEVHHTHVRIAEAVLEGDADAAERRMRRHLESVRAFIEPPADGSRRAAAPKGAKAPSARGAVATRRRKARSRRRG